MKITRSLTFRAKFILCVTISKVIPSLARHAVEQLEFQENMPTLFNGQQADAFALQLVE